MKTTVIISGFGGQGVMSAGKMLADTASELGLNAIYLPEYGPQQRGGKAKCTVSVSDKNDTVYSPLKRYCDCLIALNDLSLQTFLPQLKKGGILVMNTSIIKSEPDRDDIKIIKVPADDIAMKVKNPKAGNLIILGALTAAAGLIKGEDFKSSIEKRFKSKGQAVVNSNLAAFDEGQKLGKIV